ncbi:AraC family transcriptional regulator [Paenibacillus sp. Aloe-11]|uniref:AraC family transcriptional regulator n=1 Tax=Paenibacillus sp. Aloe-11 TaxID=1050222 RepID=UPI0002E3A74C|nr:AraC family transcriptional regulator [Paenibacillus sp. Aloe-11]
MKRRILEGETDPNTFVVIDLEASLGKSVETNKILREYIESYQFTAINYGKPYRRFLLVKRFAKDVEDSSQYIGENIDRLYQGFGDSNERIIGKGQHVIGITSDNWSYYRQNLEVVRDCDVLIITHSRYKMLCEDDELRQSFTEGRHTQIIDERIDFDIVSFSRSEYNDLFSVLSHTLHPLLYDAVNSLLNQIDACERMKTSEGKKLSSRGIIRCHPKMDSLKPLYELCNVINKNKEEIIRDKGRSAYNNLKGIVQELELFYKNTCYYNYHSLSTYNKKYRLFCLANNIILDANGQIDHLYNVKNGNIKFVLDKQSKIIDHSGSTITHIKFSTSKTNIHKKLNKEINQNEYFEKITNFIKRNYKLGKRYLIVLHKEFVLSDNGDEGGFIRQLRQVGFTDIAVGDEYNGESISINWYGNLIGKNTWRDFDCCYLLGTPNQRFESHIIHLCQYADKHDWKVSLDIVKKDKTRAFKNRDLEKIRQCDIISEMYQTVKRVQRNPKPKAEIYIVTSSGEVFNKVAKQLKGIKIAKPISLVVDDFVSKHESSDSGLSKEATMTERITDWLISQPEGIYSKKDIAKEFNIKSSHFSRYFNKDLSLVQTYISTKQIRIEYRCIIRL